MRIVLCLLDISGQHMRIVLCLLDMSGQYIRVVLCLLDMSGTSQKLFMVYHKYLILITESRG